MTRDSLGEWERAGHAQDTPGRKQQEDRLGDGKCLASLGRSEQFRIAELWWRAAPEETEKAGDGRFWRAKSYLIGNSSQRFATRKWHHQMRVLEKNSSGSNLQDEMKEEEGYCSICPNYTEIKLLMVFFCILFCLVSWFGRILKSHDSVSVYIIVTQRLLNEASEWMNEYIYLMGKFFNLKKI